MSMPKYTFNYAVFDNDRICFEHDVEVSLTKADFEEIEKSIIDHNYSCEFKDLPANIYDKCVRIAVDHAFTHSPAGENEDCMVSVGDIIPESFLDELTPETQQKVYDNIPDEYLLEDDE